MIQVIINGARGRMGQALFACAARLPGLNVSAQIDLGDDLKLVIGQGQVVIDFTFHDATASVAETCLSHGKPLIIGTTGQTAPDRARIVRCSEGIPLVWASNFSTGVNTLFWLTRQAARILGAGYDVEIVEMHHRHKKDAPSGTAASLAQILAEVRRLELGEVIRHGREGIVGERTAGEIGMHSLRGGDVVGDHTVVFATDGERLELTHRASSRDTFALGALRAAQWVVNQAPGLYDMEDVLGLK
jgi:4-hydroxy-tetrahydrodipicolinate reductase